MGDLYELLDVAPEATADEIKAAYRKLALKVHPDAGGNAALFRQVQDAFETLSDPAKRAAYDRSRCAAPPPDDPEPEPEPEPEAEPAWPEDDSEWVVVEDSEDPIAPPSRRDRADSSRHRAGAARRTWEAATSPRGIGTAVGAVVGGSWGAQVIALTRGGGAIETTLTFIVLLGFVGALAWPTLVARRGARGAARVAALAALGPALVVGLAAWLALRGAARAEKRA